MYAAPAHVTPEHVDDLQCTLTWRADKLVAFRWYLLLQQLGPLGKSFQDTQLSVLFCGSHLRLHTRKPWVEPGTREDNVWMPYSLFDGKLEMQPPTVEMCLSQATLLEFCADSITKVINPVNSIIMSDPDVGIHRFGQGGEYGLLVSAQFDVSPATARGPVRLSHLRTWTANCMLRNCFPRIFQRNMLSGFQAHSNIPESQASVLTGLTTKSATNLMSNHQRQCSSRVKECMWQTTHQGEMPGTSRPPASGSNCR